MLRFRKAMLVFRKDWREVRRNWQVILPIIILPLFFSVILPLLIWVIPGIAALPGSSLGGLEALIRNMPGNVQDELKGMTAAQTMLYVMALYWFAPFFLIIPLMASSVIASDSFAGEKERRTIEALLATPLSDSELFLGKILVSFIPSMIITIACFLIYSTLIDTVSFFVLNGRLLLPNVTWVMLIFGLSPAVSLAAIGLTVMISAKVKGVREAQQISGTLLIPIIALILGQVSGAIIFGPTIVGILMGAFVIADFVVFRLGVRTFGREEILSKLA